MCSTHFIDVLFILPALVFHPFSKASRNADDQLRFLLYKGETIPEKTYTTFSFQGPKLREIARQTLVKSWMENYCFKNTFKNLSLTQSAIYQMVREYIRTKTSDVKVKRLHEYLEKKKENSKSLQSESLHKNSSNKN